MIKNPKKILVAGDSVLSKTTLSNILSEIGHKVWISRSAREALDKIKEAPEELDLLILDMQNIDINAYEVLEWLKGEMAVKPSILSIIGAHDISHNFECLKELGVNGVIAKGFSPEQIVFRVNRLLYSEKVNYRQEPRLPLSVPLEFFIADESHTSVLYNISATGFFLQTKKELLPGTLLQVKLVLPRIERVMNIKGTVRWSTRPSDDENYFYGIGVQFTSILNEDKEIIRRYIQEELKKFDPEILDLIQDCK